MSFVVGSRNPIADRTMSKNVITAANGAKPNPVLNNLIVSGDKAYLAGVLGTDASGALVPGGVKAEAVQALKNAAERLGHAGLDLSDGERVRFAIR